ncbi:MAG: hypothetical protein GX591_16190 [Planctomycetes bacterium]|nr:hypothetical protein [Planctomycetota bacterium]
MITTTTVRGAGSSLLRAGLCVFLIAAGALLGCSPKGITLDEFLAMERQATAEVANPAPAPTFGERLSPFTVGPGDVLGVSVLGGQDTATPIAVAVRVYDDGTVDLPLVGAVAVGGLQLTQAEKAIQAAYVEKAFQEAVVHVVLEEPDTIEVLVTGPVGRPGLVRLARNERGLVQAMAAAGGYLPSSGCVTLVRLRDPGKTVTVNLANPDEVRGAMTMPPLQDGDMIAVATADPNTVFVGGLVNVPGPQSYPPGVRVTVLQAVAAAAGLRTDIFPDEAVLVRHRPDGTDVRVCLDLSRITDGDDPNIELAAGDILWVPHTFETRVQEWINRNIYFRAGAAASVNYNFVHTKDILNGDEDDTSIFIGN